MDQSASAVAIAAFTDEAGELPLVDVVEYGSGIAWTIERVVSLSGSWETIGVVVDPGGPAASLIPRLAEYGLRVIETTTREVAQASALVLQRRGAGHPPSPWLSAADAERAGSRQALAVAIVGV